MTPPPLLLHKGLCLAIFLAPLFLAPVIASVPPSTSLDSGLFGALGGLFAAALIAPMGGALVGLMPWGPEPLGPVPAAAPAHVIALLAGGASDVTPSFPAPAWAGGAAIGLGGLWSRRLGPHRAVWAWDVVEVAALDLWLAEISADHAWGSGAPLRGGHWGGGGLRLFRIGLAASHHHLSASGSFTAADATIGAGPAPFGAIGAAFLPALRGPATVAQRLSPGASVPYRPGPWAPGEGSLATWACALLAPSGGALSAWGLWLAPLYVSAGVLAMVGPFLWPSPLSRGAAASHAPLAPLAHSFGGGLPWGLASPLQRAARS